MSDPSRREDKPIQWERRTIERLLYAGIRDRRAQRRWRIIRNVLWMLLFAALIWAIAAGNRMAPKSGAGPHTAVITLDGEIGSGADVNADRVLPALRRALKDERTQALILKINSPGGSPVQAGLINDEIRRLRALHGKPIYAVVEDTAASAAYYVAVAADKIYVDKASIVGSIGVLMNGFGFVDVMKKIGVERRLLTAGDHKGFLDPFSPQTESDKQLAQQMLSNIHRQFIKVVQEGRGDRLKEAPDLFSGLFWTGEQSIAMGLADDYGSVDSVARDVVKAEKTLDYTEKGNVAERLARRFGAAAGAGAVAALRASVDWH